MIAIVHILLIMVLVRVSIERDRPLLFGGIYAAVWLAFRLPYAFGSGGAFAAMAVGFVGALLGAGVFFRMLSWAGDGVRWWLVVLAGNLLVYGSGEIVYEFVFGALVK